MSTSEFEEAPVLTLKVFMNKQKSKVLFAEAESRFVDALLTFLALQLANVMDLLGATQANGPPTFFESLAELRRSFVNDEALMNLSEVCGSGTCLDMLLSPISSLADELARIKLDISQSRRTKYHICRNPCCVTVYRMENYCVYLGDAYACSSCGKKLVGKECDDFGAGKLTRDDLTFIIFDDLRMLPNVNGFRQTLYDLGIKNLNDVEMVTWGFDMRRMTFLFELAMYSTTPLTDYAINCVGKKRDDLDHYIHSKISNPGDLFPEKNPLSSFHFSLLEMMNLTASLQKSTHKFLYAVARSDFIEFLLSLLAIPLGGVEFLFGCNTAFKSIDNLYSSVRDKIGLKYFAKPRIREMLINSKLPCGYDSRREFLIVSERTPPPIYVRRDEKNIYSYLSCDEKRGALASFKTTSSPNSNACFVKENSMCILRDDLNATPYSVASTISLLKMQGIPLSDVEEMQLPIGLNEAMRILKASITSKNVITDSLVTPKLEKMKKEPKRQRT